MVLVLVGVVLPCALDEILLPATAIEEFIDLQRPPQVNVVVIGRPGTDLLLVGEARSRLVAGPAVTPSAVEIGWSPV